jgi:peptidoglycan/xylan/chitin deacetylase (PgdA/CDA1 family)
MNTELDNKIRQHIIKRLPRLAFSLRLLRKGVILFLGSVSKKFDRLYKKFFPSATIFLYHRIENVSRDPHKLCVSKENFYKHIEYISKNYRAVKLSTLIKELEMGKLTQNTIAITFDDGYLDNIANALPILKKFGIPATIFITAGVIEKQFYWEKEREGYTPGRALSKKDLIYLTGDDLIEIGSHTMTHSRLSQQSYEKQVWEIQESKRVIENIINKTVNGFAYPFGTVKDFNRETVKLVKKSYKYACANFPGIVTKRTGVFALPRINIQNWDIKKFINEI